MVAGWFNGWFQLGLFLGKPRFVHGIVIGLVGLVFCVVVCSKQTSGARPRTCVVFQVRLDCSRALNLPEGFSGRSTSSGYGVGGVLPG